MPKLIVISDHAKKYIRLNHSRMSIAQMHKNLHISWHTVDGFMQAEGLERMAPRRKRTHNSERGGRHNVTRNIKAKPGMFLVTQHENWIV